MTWAWAGMGQYETTRKPQVFFFVPIFQCHTLGPVFFLTHTHLALLSRVFFGHKSLRKKALNGGDLDEPLAALGGIKSIVDTAVNAVKSGAEKLRHNLLGEDGTSRWCASCFWLGAGGKCL